MSQLNPLPPLHLSLRSGWPVARAAIMLLTLLGLLASFAIADGPTPTPTPTLTPTPTPAPALAPAQPPSAGAPTSVPASRFAKNVAIITIHGEINATTARSVKRRLQEAVVGGADAIVFDINSPGGEVGAVLEITSGIKSCRVTNTVAWIHPMAYSGGAIIALSCRQMVVASSAAFGDAAPIALDPVQGLKNLGATERAKILAPLLTEIVDSARRNGYDEKLVQGMVMLGVELWLIENTTDPTRRFMVDRTEYKTIFGAEPPAGSPRLVSGTQSRPAGGGATPAAPAGPTNPTATSPDARPPANGFIPAAPGTPESLIRDVNFGLDAVSTRPVFSAADRGKWRLVEYVSDGQAIVTMRESEMLSYRFAIGTIDTDEQLKAFFGATNMSRLEPSWSEGLVEFLSKMYVRGVMTVIFLVMLFLEMTHPGLVLPGTVAAVALVVLLAPVMLIGMADWWEVLAILAGIVLIALEILVLPGFGVPGVLGLVLLMGGLLGTFVPSGSGGLFPDTAQGQQDLVYGVATLAVSVVTSIVLMYFVGKHFGRLPVLNHLILQSPDAQDDSPGMLEAMGSPVGEGPVPVGAIGRAITPLRPSGRVEIGEQIIDVVAEIGFIPAGSMVRVTSADAFRVTVEAAPQTKEGTA